jgi:hypothetical protein
MSDPVFVPGQRVRCIDARASFNRLAEGAIYTVTRCDGNAVYVEGVQPNHSAERFTAVWDGISARQQRGGTFGS